MFTKEPQEVAVFGIDWSDWLGATTIASSTWVAPTGITIDDEDFTTTDAAVTLSGGTWGETYELFNTIVAGAETETRSIIVTIQRSVSYCTALEVRRRLAHDTTSATTLPLAELEAFIEQASRYLDTLCGVEAGYFDPSHIPIVQPRTFYGDGTHYLRIDPFVAASITAVDFPEDYTAPDYVARDNYLLRTGETHILPAGFRTWWPWYGGWPEGVPVTVTAIWGFRETPPEVKMATIELVINLFRETDPAQVNLTDLERQRLREQVPPRVAAVIQKYKLKTNPAFV